MNTKILPYYHRISPANNLSCIVLVIILMQISAVSLADNVKIYDRMPSANEMANLLFPKSSKQIKMRSISFDHLESTPQLKARTDLATISEHFGISLPIRFDFNSDSIPNTSRPYIDELGKMLSRKDLLNERVVIEGHTDAYGGILYNKQLSMKRAQSIKQYLFDQYGIDRHRMTVSGKGEFQPLKGQNPFAAVNRRVEIHNSP